MSKLTSLTAVRPPNRFVMFFADSSIVPFCTTVFAGTATVGVSAAVTARSPRAGRRSPLPGRPIGYAARASAAAREQALRAEQHHDDQGEAVQQELVLHEVDVLQDRDMKLLEERVELLQ
jgi:hypothetical protein